MAKQLNIWIIGAWVVGSEVVRLVNANQQAYSKKLWKVLSIKWVYTRNPQWEKSKDIYESNPEIFVDSPDQLIKDPSIDIIVETVWWVWFSKAIIINSMWNWKSVVTANKDLISTHWEDLMKVSNDMNVWFWFEASVAWWIPIINALSTGLVWDNIRWLKWIINWTCNYILTKLKQNPTLSYKEVLVEAQKLGYAESDPTNDVEWIDSFYKLSILSWIWFWKLLKKEETNISWISSIDWIDFKYADILDRTIKLLGVVNLSKENILEAFVWPVLIKNSHPLASINWVTNALDVIWENANNTFSGPWAGGKATASSILSDIINIWSKIDEKWRFLWNNTNLSNQDVLLWEIEKSKFKFYCRFVIQDQTWVLSKTCSILEKYWISVDQVLQHSHTQDEKKNLPYVMTLETVDEGMLRKAIREIDSLSFIKSPTFVMRILD